VPPGILAEPGERDGADRGGDQPQFKGIFVRNLYELYRHSPRAEYRDFILANATSLWRHSRNRRNQIGLAWNGPFDRADAARQGSALDALNAAVGVTDPAGIGKN
jgi:predicted alpha-1,6-mannanase (GH76 family)